ncbi:hypothetical protein HaLaN_04574 [Haematococcus lacustris]|uniref:Uncharacterized protein n=1 Tax=Haematococcus lacustris TaxID=44745 RepID=A0A699YRM0_HAELA|nr:hypothetical protein HaLaN_04574 [Haematococcus lacustris]
MSGIGGQRCHIHRIKLPKAVKGCRGPLRRGDRLALKVTTLLPEFQTAVRHKCVLTLGHQRRAAPLRKHACVGHSSGCPLAKRVSNAVLRKEDVHCLVVQSDQQVMAFHVTTFHVNLFRGQAVRVGWSKGNQLIGAGVEGQDPYQVTKAAAVR